ncbi:MAG: hypothetical protein IPM55_13240 [Acidobacteria bacterium]|nr:hypothetical protein [Acidobacteriota bacterium]
MKLKQIDDRDMAGLFRPQEGMQTLAQDSSKWRITERGDRVQVELFRRGFTRKN